VISPVTRVIVSVGVIWGSKAVWALAAAVRSSRPSRPMAGVRIPEFSLVAGRDEVRRRPGGEGRDPDLGL